MLALFTRLALAQESSIDGLKRALVQSNADTTKVNLYSTISQRYNYRYPDSVLYYALPGLALARKLHFPKRAIYLMNWIGEAHSTKGNYPKALESKLQALQLAQQLGDPYLISTAHNYLGALYFKTGEYGKALTYYQRAKANQAYYRDYQKYVLGMMGACYFYLNRLDSAYSYTRNAYAMDVTDTTHWTVPYYRMAEIMKRKGDYAQAIRFYRIGNQLARPDALDIFNGYNGLASLFRKINRPDSAIHYAKKVVPAAVTRSHYAAVLDASALLADIYKANTATDSAFKYQEILLAMKDSLFSQEKVRLIQMLAFGEQQRQQQLQQEQKEARQRFETKVKLYSLLAGLAALSLIAFILYRNNRHKQQANALLEQRNEEILSQRDHLEQTLATLQATQAQLIQREKMASLGELTAGIAHEIQNPLNFVNNFAEVNQELLAEIKLEIEKGNLGEIRTLVGELEANEHRIHHHGQRADGIVKGMMQHSRTTAGEKQLTDLNALAEEYLRLSYHGLKAKDKDFNANLVTDLDSQLAKVKVAPQELGRVLLNLFNNAFYATQQQKSQSNGAYHPEVKVSTRKLAGQVVITVSDNGSGMPESVKSKIFQPFFTTKPTGQGTGLGLSLSYDIIKGHGGELRVESQEGDGAAFTISLPTK